MLMFEEKKRNESRRVKGKHGVVGESEIIKNNNWTENLGKFEVKSFISWKTSKQFADFPSPPTTTSI